MQESVQITQHGLALLVNMASVMRTQMANFCFHYAPSTIPHSQTHSSNWAMLTKPPACIRDWSTGMKLIFSSAENITCMTFASPEQWEALNAQQTTFSSDQRCTSRCKEREGPRARNLQQINVAVQKISNPGITVALQNELSKCLKQVAFTKAETEESWAKLEIEVDTAATETIDFLKRHHQDCFDNNDFEIYSLLAGKYAAHKHWLADE